MIRARERAGKAACLVCLVGTLFVSVRTFGAGAEAWTPEHVMKIRRVGTAKMAPDGRHIAFTLRVPRPVGSDNDGAPWTELHVVDLQGHTRPFVTGKVNVGGIAWTPDGSGISFTAKRGDDKHARLYVIPIDGGEARAVLTHEAGIGSYSWSPDGERVAFTAKAKKSEALEKQADRGFKAEVYEEDWRNTHLWIARVDAEDDDDGPQKIEVDGSVSAVRWNPTGDGLAVAIAATPSVDDGLMFRKLMMVDRGGNERPVDNVGKLGDFAWAPDGKHLAYVSGIDINDPADGRLMVIPASGGAPRELLPGYPGHVEAIAWQSADTIMYLGAEGVHSRFAKIGLDEQQRTLFEPDAPPVLAGLSLSDDGQSACFVGQKPDHPSEVYHMRHGDRAPRRLTDSNPWLADMQIARQEVVEYPARDGETIQGLLIRPMNETAGKRYPLILAVHGGPESRDANGWLTRYADPGQLGAQRGFAIFYPNYRGSTGRGVAFTKAHQHDYGGKEFNDLVDAIEHFVKIGLVDRSKVGITGGSYGGFASAWAATKLTEHFAASVMFVGISDQVSKAGTTDIPQEMYLVHARAWPWDEWEFFRERSPITYVKQARTPLLILHGKEDPRVHPSQSLELYRFLKVIGKTPVRLVLYPGEGHGNRKMGAQYDYCLRMMRWFEHYLMGPGGDPPAHTLDYGLADEDTVEDDIADE